MNIPSIPTDSLYKFLAIFGLILTVAGVYFYLDYSSRLEVKRDKYENTIDVLNYEIGETNENLEYFISQIEMKCKLSPCYCEIISKSNYQIQVKTIKKDCDESIDMVYEIVNLQDSIAQVTKYTSKMRVKVKSMERVLIRKEKESLENFLLIKSMIVFGLFLSIAGFIFWYFLIQRYVDHILRTQAVSNQKIYGYLNKNRNK